MPLKPGKCVIAPIGEAFSESITGEIKGWLGTHLPAWKDFAVTAAGRYLGFYMGPAATREMQFKQPLAKMSLRVDAIAAAGVAGSIGAVLYNTRVAPCTGYIGQLIPPPP